jgi:hypothetical protein
MGLRDRLTALFPVDDAPRSGRFGWAWLVLVVIGGALISLGRVSQGPGVLNTIWAEDGSDFLTDALNRSVPDAIFKPLNGYYVTVPRLLAEPASLVPVQWGPTVLTIEAAVVAALMALAVYVASRSHLRNPLARLIAAVPVVAVPVGENVAAATANNVATLQFAAIYTALWMVLWNPTRRTGRVIAGGVVLAVALSTFLVVAVLPLAVVRLVLRRDKTSAFMVGSLVLGAALNVMALSLHLTERPVMAPSRYDPVWALQSVADWALPHAMFGYRISGEGAQAVDPAWLVWPAWLIVLTVVIVAAARLTNPRWALAAILAVHAIVLVSGSIMQLGVLELRYVVGFELMLYAALAALLLPRLAHPRWLAWAPLASLAVLVAVALATSYQTFSPRDRLFAWDAAVDKARVVCANKQYSAVYIRTWSEPGSVEPVYAGTPMPPVPPYGFPIRVPCARLR